MQCKYVSNCVEKIMNKFKVPICVVIVLTAMSPLLLCIQLLCLHYLSFSLPPPPPPSLLLSLWQVAQQAFVQKSPLCNKVLSWLTLSFSVALSFCAPPPPPPSPSLPLCLCLCLSFTFCTPHHFLVFFNWSRIYNASCLWNCYADMYATMTVIIIMKLKVTCECIYIYI